ncbi:MAG: gamma-glutamylcyclotransferase family protein [archaeon]|jgi:gamma-glutamylcyclotransferase (GGCT)/AIG2-like uncharacterized protein YtfP
MVYYFAYGSNMSERQMDERIGIANYKFFSCGKLLGYELRFNKTPRNIENPKKGYANIEPKENSVVEGIIFEIDSIAISKLDKYECVPEHYVRKQLIVNALDKEILCEVYFAVKTRDGLKPEKVYLDRLLKGKVYLSEKYYKDLKSTSTID